MSGKMILITITGPDRPGIIAAVTEHIADSGARIRDIEQTVTHTLLSLSVLIDGARKAELLETIAADEGITLDQVVAVGDGANDLPMLGKAGLGVAFNAKARVREQADTHLNQQSLDSLLYLLGLCEWDLAELEG